MLKVKMQTNQLFACPGIFSIAIDFFAVFVL